METPTDAGTRPNEHTWTLRHFTVSWPLETALGAKLTDVDDLMDVVGAVVAFANRDTTPNWMERARLQPGRGKRWLWFNEAGERISEANAKSIAEATLQEENQFAIDVLNDAASGFKKLVQRIQCEKMSGKLSGVSMQPVLKWNKGRLSMRFRLTGPRSDATGWVLFAAAVLADRSNGVTTDVGRCSLPSCGRFFVVDRVARGKPRTKFCCKEHAEEHHFAGGTERKKRSRIAHRKNARKTR